MDLEKLTRTSYPKAATIGFILSLIVVMLAALLGRGALQIRGALTSSEPTELTVTELLLTKFPERSTVQVMPLPKREEAKTYDFFAEMSDDTQYVVRIGKDGPPWTLASVETMRAD